jgi:hypothetical protein
MLKQEDKPEKLNFPVFFPSRFAVLAVILVR